jgi:hypothetical protein
MVTSPTNLRIPNQENTEFFDVTISPYIVQISLSMNNNSSITGENNKGENFATVPKWINT